MRNLNERERETRMFVLYTVHEDEMMFGRRNKYHAPKEKKKSLET